MEDDFSKIRNYKDWEIKLLMGYDIEEFELELRHGHEQLEWEFEISEDYSQYLKKIQEDKIKQEKDNQARLAYYKLNFNNKPLDN